jgi:hypothetical protein
MCVLLCVSVIGPRVNCCTLVCVRVYVCVYFVCVYVSVCACAREMMGRMVEQRW